MANVIGEFVAKIGADTGKFNKGVDKADTRMGKFAAGVKKHGKMIALAFIAIGTAATATALKIVKDYAKAGDEIQKMALRTDFATESLSEFKHALELSGASLETLEKGVKKMAKTIVDAADGLATYVRAFDRMGLSAEELINLAPEKQFEKITMALAAMENPTLRAATAQEVFGRAGTALLPMLAQGAEGIAAMRQEARDLGLVFDQEAADAAAKFNDDLLRLKGTVTGLKMEIAEELLPTLNTLAVSFTQLLKGEGVFGKKGQAVNALIEARSEFLAEQEKAQRGLDNQMAESARKLIQVAKAWKKTADGGIANLDLLGQIVGPLERWLAVEDERIKALELEEERLKSVIAAETAREDILGRTVEGLRLAALEEKKLADAVIAAEEAKRFARTGRAVGLIEQIIEAGGMPSRGRLLEAELLLGGFNPLQGGFDMIMDGQKVGEIVGEGMGDEFLGESHMSGG